MKKESTSARKCGETRRQALRAWATRTVPDTAHMADLKTRLIVFFISIIMSNVTCYFQVCYDFVFS